MEKKLVLLFALTLGLVLPTSAWAQTYFNFDAATYSSTTKGYELSGIGAFFKGTSGGAATLGSITGGCDGFTAYAPTSSSIFYFRIDNLLPAGTNVITIRGQGTGSNRTFSSLATSSTLAGTYTAVTASGSGTISSGVCGSITITTSAAIASGSYLKVTLGGGNVNITSIGFVFGTAPTVSAITAPATIGTTTASVAGGTISAIGSGVTTSGICWNTSGTPTTADSKTTDGPTTASTWTNSSLSGLTANTLYYVRAYASNSYGTSYSASSQTFTTLANAPTSSAASSISSISFTANWSAPTGGSAVYTYTLDYSTDNTFTTSVTEITSITSTLTSQAIAGLNAATIYYYHVKAVNATGSSDWSATQTATTGAATPTIALSTSSVAFGNKTINSVSATSYTISGSYLTDNVVVTPPADFQISNDSSTWSSAAVTVVPTSGSVSQKIYVRFNPTAIQAYSGAITHTSTGATEQDIAVSGTGIAVQPVTSFAASTANAQSVLTWTSPAGSYDEVIVLAKSGNAVDQTPSGDGSAYTANAAFGSGTDIGSGSFVVFKGTTATVTVTGLTNATAYYYAAYVRYGSVWSVVATANATPSPFVVGDFGSVANGDWTTNVTTVWKKWDGSGWNTAVTAVPTSSDNVWILGGDTIVLASGGKTCKNLHVVNGVLYGNSVASAPKYVGIYGSTIEVDAAGILGSTKIGDNADAISLDIQSSNVTITGTGGTISIDRLRTNIASTTVTIDHDVILNYHGTANAGNAMAYYTVAGDNNTLIINVGKTLTFAPWACMAISATSHTSGTLGQTVNINGTMTFAPGTPHGDTNTVVNGWAGHNSNYMSLGIVGKWYYLNIGSNGTLNATEFYPQGTKANNSAGSGSGDSVVINIAAGGAINVSGVADFRNSKQIISGGGAFNLLSGAALRIGNAAGIAASATSGSIQTSIRSFSSGASYYYDTTATAQVTGDGLPSAVNKLLVSNSAGVTLSNSLEVDTTLTLMGGTLSLGANTLTLNGSIAKTNGSLTGSSSSNLVVGGNGSALTLPAVEVNNFTLNRSNGAALIGNVKVDGALTLSGGNITTDTNSLAIASTGSVARTSGFVVGNLRKNYAAGSSVAHTFEIGSGSIYAPVSVTFATVNTAGDIIAKTVSGDHPNISTSGIDANKSVNRYWTLADSGVAFDTYTATLNYDSSEVDASAAPANFRAKGYASSAWSPLTISSPTKTSTQIIGMTTFGDVALGEKAGFIITATASKGGTITPSGSVAVSYGTDTTFTIAASAGHYLDSVVVDGVNQSSITNYKFTNVVAAHSIAAYFTAEKRTIHVAANGNGTVTPVDSVIIDYGTDTTFAITPSTGYQVDSVLVGGVNVGAVTSYKFTNVTVSSSIAAYFSTAKFIITATAFGGGTITPSGSVVVLYGVDTTFTITPNTGASIDSVIVDRTNAGAVTSYKFSSVTAAHIIKAYFSSPYVTLSVSSIAMGTSAVGVNKIDSVTVTNSGSASLSITNVAVADTHFVVSPTLATIAQAASQKFYITFKPDTNAYASKIVFTSNTAKGLDTLTVSAIGYEKMSASHARMVAGGSAKISTYVQGVITRALSGSSYIRIQDTTGGATLYGASSLKDSVTSGAIKAGDVVYVHGLGTTYNNLQEISTMISWSKIKSDTVPAPVVLTLAQLVANAEYYESMLLQLKNVSTTGTSPFAYNVNYSLTDATESTGAIKLYLHNGESSIIGVPIPTGAFNLTGVMTQFSTTYEITPILTTDIQIVTSIDASKTGIPKAYELSNNYPNPFNPSTTISFGLPSQSRVTVKVFSILGQEVATLMDGVQEAGYHNAVWNGHNSSGIQAASGVYLLRVMAQSTSGNASFTQVRKMILLK